MSIPNNRTWLPRDATPADRPSLTSVFNAAFKRNDPPELLDWRYDRNPHGKAWTVVAAAEDNHELAGAYSYVPRMFMINGIATKVFQASDAMVFPNWQRKGIFTKLDDLLAERAAHEGVAFGFAFCGRRSQKGFLANGWKGIAPYRTWTRILKLTTAAFEARRSDGRLRRALLPLELLRAKSADAMIKKSLEGFSDRPIDQFTENFDWPAANQSIYGVRDANYLQWRFHSTPRRTHRPYHLLQNGRVVGFYDVECTKNGRGYLLDARGDGAACEFAALAAAVERLRMLGAAAIQTTVVERSFLDTHIAKLGFEPPRDAEPLPFIIRIFTDNAASRAAMDAKNWYIFDGDRDAEGMAPND
ncbi:MAG: GNAT family N-acetyltransferase [Planctomycetota bacterium]